MSLSHHQPFPSNCKKLQTELCGGFEHWSKIHHSWKSITQMIIRHCQCHQPLYQKGSNNLSCFNRYRLIRKWNPGPWMHKKNIQELIHAITKQRFYSVLWPCIKGIVHPKNIFFIIYSPSCLSKPIWVTFLCWTQKKIFWRILKKKKQLLVLILGKEIL